jgi:hypothetical protein
LKFLKSYINYNNIACGYRLESTGEIMSEIVWYWTNGNNKIFTKNTEVAEEAMKKGMLIMGKKAKPNIVKY